MSSGEEENDEIPEPGQIDETDPVFRSVAEADVSLDEMMSLACRQGKLDIVELLLESGAHVDYRNKAGNTPLLEACSQGHVDVARYLLDHNANIDAPTETTSDSALTWACTLGNEAIVELLLERTSNVEHRTKDGCTALMFAALAGHVKVAAMLLDHSAEINVESDSNKDSPLTFACWKGHCDVVELLLERDANIEHRTKEGFTPLMFAALGGHTDVARKLLEMKAMVNVPSGSNNDIPLTSACWKGHHDVVKLLLEFSSNIEHRTKDGCTPLMLAAREGHYSVAKLILDSNAKVNVPSGSENNIPLTLACWKGHTKVVELLLEHKSNIEHRNKAGCTPLMLASREGHVDTTRLLLKKGAEINTPSGSNDDTPLTLACWKGHVEVVDLLLKHSSKGDHQTKTGCTPLMEATREGHVAVAEQLLLHGADVELPDNYGQSPLFMACWKGHKDVAELLLENVANRDCRTKTGITPLFQACRENHVDIVELLLDYGASVNASFPNSRENPLTLAGEKGHVELVSLLLSRMANVECHTKKGCTPFHLACKEGHLEISKLLHKHGADMEACDSRNNSPLVAAMKNGHIEVVEWLIGVANHLPSEDQCQKSLVAPVDDKGKFDEIMLGRTKCYDVVTKAKKAREQKVQRNTELFLKELELEKEIQDVKKKKVAAKRRDKRKRRKAAKDNNMPCVEQEVDDVPLENRPQEVSLDDDDDDDKQGGGADGDCGVVDTTRPCTEPPVIETKDKPATSEKTEITQAQDTAKSKQSTKQNKNNKRPSVDAKTGPSKLKRPLSSTVDNVSTSANAVDLNEQGRQRSQSAGKESDLKHQSVQSKYSGPKTDELSKCAKKKGSSSNCDKVDPANAQNVEVKTKTMSEDTQSEPVNFTKPDVKQHVKSEAKQTPKKEQPEKGKATGTPSKSPQNKPQASVSATHGVNKIVSAETNNSVTTTRTSSSATPACGKRSKDATDNTQGSLVGNESNKASVKAALSTTLNSHGSNKTVSSDGEREHSKPVHSPRSKLSPYQVGRSEDNWKEVTRNSNSKTVMFQLTAPNAICGRVIGRGGSKINSITEDSGAQITIGKPESKITTDRVISIKGSSKAVQRAKFLVTQALNTPSTIGQSTPTTSSTTMSSAVSSSYRMETNTSPAPVRGNFAAIPSSSSEWPTIEQANNMAVQTPSAKSTAANKNETKDRKNSPSSSEGNEEAFEENFDTVTSQSEMAATRVNSVQTCTSSSVIVSDTMSTASPAWKPYRPLPQSMGACTSAVTTASSSSVTTGSSNCTESRASSRRLSNGSELSLLNAYTRQRNEGTLVQGHIRRNSGGESTAPFRTSQEMQGSKGSSSSPTSTATVSLSTSAGTTSAYRDHNAATENPYGVIGDVANTALQTEAIASNSLSTVPPPQRDPLPPNRGPPQTSSTAVVSGLLTSPREQNKSKFPYFSPWASQGTGISATESFSSGRKLKGSLPGMDLFTGSLFSNSSLSSYPWSTGEEGNEERSQSMGWSGQMQHEYQGDQQFISPSKDKFSSSIQKSVADSAVNIRASDLRADSGTFKPLSSGIWAPVVTQSHATSLSVICDDGTPDKQAWNNSDSTSSSRSSSRQELSSIMDSEIPGNNSVWNSSAFAEDMTPTPQQSTGGMNTALSDQGVPSGSQWVPGRAAYSAPSSPSLPRTHSLPESAPPSMGGRPSVDDFAIHSWASKQRSPRSLSSSEPSTTWNEDLPTQQRRSSVDLSQSVSGESVIPTLPWAQYSRMRQASFPAVLAMRENWPENLSASVSNSEVNQLLHKLGLEKYISVFEEHGIDGTQLSQMVEEDLENLGIPKGPRLKILFAVYGGRGSSGNTYQTPGNGFVKMDQSHVIIPPPKKPNKMEPAPFTNHNHILAQHSSDSHFALLGHKSKQPLKQTIHPSHLPQPPSNPGNQHLLSLMTNPGAGGRTMNLLQHMGIANQNHSNGLPPRPHSATGNMTSSQTYVSVGSHSDHGISYVPPQQAGQYMNHMPYSQGHTPAQVFYPGGFYYFYPQQ